jgi:DNA-binding transcriptional LysR family regulator
MYLLPRLMAHLAIHAPNVSLSTVAENEGDLKSDMEMGNVDLAIGLLPQLEAGFYQRRLFEQRYVCLMRQAHPLSTLELSLEKFLQAKHIIIEARGTGHGRAEKTLIQNGVSRISKLRVTHFMSVPYIVSETDLIATVTEKLALQTQKRFDLVMRPHPVGIDPVQINLFWHRRFHRDTGNIWLRNVIFELFSQ